MYTRYDDDILQKSFFLELTHNNALNVDRKPGSANCGNTFISLQ